MKCAISMWSLHKYYFDKTINVVDFLDYAAEIKADGVELLDVFWRDIESELPQVEAKLKETGLPVACYSTGNNFANPDAEARQADIQRMRQAIDMAVRFGAPVVRVFAGDLAEGVAYEQARTWIVEGLKSVVPYAEEKGIRLALENHGLMAGKGQQVKELIQSVGSDVLGSTFDCGNFLLVEDTPEAAIEILLPYVYHVHFKDFRPAPEDFDGPSYKGLGGTHLVGTIAGEGMVDLEVILGRLQQHGYDGWLAVEFEGLEEPREGTKESLQNLRTVLAKL